MSSFDWKSLAVGITSLIVVVGTALIIMSPFKSNDPVAMQCLGYESNAPAMIFTFAISIGIIIGFALCCAVFKPDKKEVK